MKWLFWRFLKMLEKVRYNDYVHCWFPVEKRIVKMKVSSIRVDCFAAKFPDGEEPEYIDSLENYNQLDNDILFDNKTREPIVMRPKKTV